MQILVCCSIKIVSHLAQGAALICVPVLTNILVNKVTCGPSLSCQPNLGLHISVVHRGVVLHGKHYLTWIVWQRPESRVTLLVRKFRIKLESGTRKNGNATKLWQTNTTMGMSNHTTNNMYSHCTVREVTISLLMNKDHLTGEVKHGDPQDTSPDTGGTESRSKWTHLTRLPQWLPQVHTGDGVAMGSDTHQPLRVVTSLTVQSNKQSISNKERGKCMA